MDEGGIGWWRVEGDGRSWLFNKPPAHLSVFALCFSLSVLCLYAHPTAECVRSVHKQEQTREYQKRKYFPIPLVLR